MNAITFIKASLEASQGWAATLLRDLQDAPLTQPSPAGGNHPLCN